MAVKVMALGKPTVAYIRNNLVDKLDNCSIIASNPKTLTQDLSNLLKGEAKLQSVGKQSRKFSKILSLFRSRSQEGIGNL